MHPLSFEPFLRPMVWGGRRLAHVLGKLLPDDRAYGESWEVSDHPVHRSVASHGHHRGKTLRQLLEAHPHELLGPGADAGSAFPWLIKFLDAHDWLSVQVHPDEHSVARLWPGEGSKTEAWFVLDAAPGSKIYAGLLPGVDEAALRKATAAGTVAECLHVFTPRPGDCVFLPAGTVHAVGGGVLIAEVQQTSDATFRLFDWNRRDAQGQSRTLHIEESMQAIHWSQGPVTPRHAAGFTAAVSPNASQPLVECPYFRLEYADHDRAFSLRGGSLRALLIVRGAAEMKSGNASDHIERGQVWLAPAAGAALHFNPSGRLAMLVCTLP